MSISPRSSPKVDVVDWHAQNRRFELAESHPRVDERNITMRKKQSTVSDQPRFPLSRKALLIKNLYDLKKTNRRFLDKKKIAIPTYSVQDMVIMVGKFKRKI